MYTVHHDPDDPGCCGPLSPTEYVCYQVSLLAILCHKSGLDTDYRLQEAASLIAKAEVLQASIGVSCSEEDIQTTTQDHIVHASVFQRSPESSKAIQSINGAVDGMQSSGAAAVDKQVEMRQDGVQGLSCVANAATDKQLSTHRYDGNATLISSHPLTYVNTTWHALADL